LGNLINVDRNVYSKVLLYWLRGKDSDEVSWMRRMVERNLVLGMVVMYDICE